MAKPKSLIIGRITRPHGVRGEVKVQPETDFPERFAALRRVLLQRGADDVREAVVESVRRQGETVLLELEMAGVCCSSGSACHAGSTEPSHVLLALGLPPALAHTAVRLTLGRDTTPAEVDRVLDLLPAAVARVRGLAVG